MVSCQMFMPALHTIWRFCLSNIVSLSVRVLGGITEYIHIFYNTTYYTTTDGSPATFHTPPYICCRRTDHELRTNDEPAELPARPTL